MNLDIISHGRTDGMTDAEFNALLNGALNHPVPLLRLTRLALALRVVVDRSGPAGVAALRAHCAEPQPGGDEHQGN